MAAPLQTQSWCNSCYRQTAHDIRAEDRLNYEDEEHNDISKSVACICCRGCGEWSIRQHTTKSVPGQPLEFAEVDISVDPPRSWRRPPEWIKQLDSMAPDLADLLREIYHAANDRQRRLLSMGVRAVLDLVMVQIVGDFATFDQKMTEMAKRGHLSPRQQDILETVIDAGSAASHRGFQPARDLLEEMLVVMESIVRDHFITNPMLSALKTKIPPRPPRRVPKPS